MLRSKFIVRLAPVFSNLRMKHVCNMNSRSGEKRGLDARRQVECPIRYDDVCIELGYRIDLLVEDQVIVELKCCTDGFHPVHKAQLLSHLRLSNKKLGLLLNFHESVLKDGILRMVNNF